MRFFLIGVVSSIAVSGCSEPPLPSRPLPPLQARRPARSITQTPIALWPGETMSWTISWRGIEIGTAELSVSGIARSTRVESHFSPGGLAAQLRPAHHQLTTSLDGERRPDDLHSAIGRVRAWARDGAAPAELVVEHRGERFDVKLASPEIERPINAPPMLRVEGEARSPQSAVELTVWLSDDSDRVPLSASVDVDGQTITAELRDYNRGR